MQQIWFFIIEKIKKYRKCPALELIMTTESRSIYDLKNLESLTQNPESLTKGWVIEQSLINRLNETIQTSLDAVHD